MLHRTLTLNGPNLNLLGQREPEIYGRTTRAEEISGDFAGLMLNAGAYSHTSIALLDALRALKEPLIEVHLSNIYQRETFRQHSYVSLAAKGVICGFGPRGYLMALDALAALLNDAS